MLDKRSTGRPKRRHVDVLKKDMKVVGVREEDAADGVRRKQTIHGGDR